MNADGEGKGWSKGWAWVMGWATVVSVLVYLGMTSGWKGAPRFNQEVYVWQRVWDEGVVGAVRERSGAFDGVRVSAAELSADGGVRAGVDYGVLAGTGKGVWLVVRMGSGFGGRLGEAGVLDRVAGELRGILEVARGAGCDVRGIEIDYDCATSRLGEYAGFMREMMGRVREVDWSVTALPSWMEDEEGFQGLVREVGRYVLQVHSLELPERGGSDVMFCDPGAARVAVRRAGKMGVPFLVALPTYSSVVVFGEDGEVVDVVSEDRAKSGGEALLVRSDPVAMAGLVEGWMRERPEAMEGVVWFRLPVDGDVRNWKWETLQVVMTGVGPVGEMSGEIEVGEDGLMTVVVRNGGAGEVIVPEVVVVRWLEGELVASDGLGGFRELVGEAERQVVFRGGSGGVLRAEENLVVGWLRGLEMSGVEVSFEL